jgi:hypothetical protein
MCLAISSPCGFGIKELIAENNIKATINPVNTQYKIFVVFIIV